MKNCQLNDTNHAVAMAKPPERVLIVKPSSLGDVVTAMPVLRGIRRSFPQAQISWLVTPACAGLIEGDDGLHEIILFERKKLGRAWRSPAAAHALWSLVRTLRQKKFDWVIDLQGLFRSGFLSWASGAKVRAGFAAAREFAPMFYTHAVRVGPPHTVDQNVGLARQLGIDARGEDMTLRVSPAARQQIEELCRKHHLPRKGFLVCVPPTRWITKQYPTRHWRTVVAALAKQMPIALVGSPDPREMASCAAVADGLGAGVPNLAGQTSVPQMVALIEASAGVICSDSAAKFIAPAVGVDVVTLLGPTRLELTGPYPRGQAIVAPTPCQGCRKKHCSHITCMELISPADVISAAETMLVSSR